MVIQFGDEERNKIKFEDIRDIYKGKDDDDDATAYLLINFKHNNSSLKLNYWRFRRECSYDSDYNKVKEMLYMENDDGC